MSKGVASAIHIKCRCETASRTIKTLAFAVIVVVVLAPGCSSQTGTGASSSGQERQCEETSLIDTAGVEVYGVYDDFVSPPTCTLKASANRLPSGFHVGIEHGRCERVAESLNASDWEKTSQGWIRCIILF